MADDSSTPLTKAGYCKDTPGYVEAGDQVLRNFLNGLIIYKRGKQDDNEKKHTEKED